MNVSKQHMDECQLMEIMLEKVRNCDLNEVLHSKQHEGQNLICKRCLSTVHLNLEFGKYPFDNRNKWGINTLHACLL